MKKNVGRKQWIRTAGTLSLAVCLLAGIGTSVPEGILALSAAEPESEAVSESVTESVDTEGAGNTAEDRILYDETVAGWHFQVENVRVDTSLQNISVDLGYSGIETSEYIKEAEEGMTFCLVKLKVEKSGSKEQIEWEKMVLTDSEGTEYHRIEDGFILDLGMKHMPGNDLNFGMNEGWIAFEIDENAEGLTLSYPFKEELIEVDFGF